VLVAAAKRWSEAIGIESGALAMEINACQSRVAALPPDMARPRVSAMPVTDEQLNDFFELFRSFLEQVHRTHGGVDDALHGLLLDHLGTDPTQLPIVSDAYSQLEHPNLQLAIDALISSSGTDARLFGLLGGNRRMMGISLRDVLAGTAAGRLSLGPVEYDSRPIGVERSLSCVALGLYLVSSPTGPVAILIHGDAQTGPRTPDVIVDVIAAATGHAEAVLADLRARAKDLNVYRGQMFSIGPGTSPFGQSVLGVTFYPRPEVRRDDIVLPGEILDRVDRHLLRIGEARERLLRAGRHLKRGLLLHGPPGTGKTLTVRYLAAAMEEATVVVVSGTGIGSLATSCKMARDLTPAIVVVEDVDLIAQDRSIPGVHGQPLLFQLTSLFHASLCRATSKNWTELPTAMDGRKSLGSTTGRV
jgi:hypothetical protein